MAQCEEDLLDVPVDERAIGGKITLNELLILVSAVCTAFACLTSIYLIMRHATNFTQPKIQKQIIRILFMVPVYSICCTLSVKFYQASVYLGAAYEFYEALVIACFFLLLCRLLHIDLASLRRVFSMLEPKPWIWPIRIWQLLFRCGRRRGQPTNGLKYFHLIWIGIFQFCIVKFLGAITKCITEALNVYCEGSKGFSHAYTPVHIIELISLATAMTFLIQFYKETKVQLAEHRPLLKFLAIKLVVFLFYLQSFIFGFITEEGGPVQPTRYASYPSLAVGLPNTLLCVEMALVSILHLWAFPWAPYKAHSIAQKGSIPDEELQPVTSENEDITTHKGGALGWRAFVAVFNFTDVFVSFFRGCMWLGVQRRHKFVPVPAEQLNDSRYDSAQELAYMSSYRTNDLSHALTVESQTRGQN